MTDLCSHVQYGVPGSLLACSREAGHDGECVFDRIPLQEEYGGIRFRLHTWSIPLLTGEAINEAEMKARAVLAIEEAKRYPNDEYPGRLVHEKATLARAYLRLVESNRVASSLLNQALIHIGFEPYDVGNCRLFVERAKKILDAAKDGEGK